jgi:hypothetical protein
MCDTVDSTRRETAEGGYNWGLDGEMSVRLYPVAWQLLVSEVVDAQIMIQEQQRDEEEEDETRRRQMEHARPRTPSQQV